MIEYICNPAGRHLEEIRDLFREYVNWLGVDLSFQDFEKELETLPGKYAPPEGTIILASVNGRPAGCVALRKIDADSCEMKRLFVRDSFRGSGIGRELVHRIIKEAVSYGYKKMLLDTLESMKSARKLYEDAGFIVRDPYYHNPLEGAVFMELDLTDYPCLTGK
jgi:GNAT superfamily N-acetyltransferase